MAIKTSEAVKENTKKKDEIVYNIEEECGTLDTKQYTKKGEEVTEELKLRYMSWNNGTPRYDLRWWVKTEDGEKCGKGVGLSGEALIALGKLINELQDDKPKAKSSSKKGK